MYTYLPHYIGSNHWKLEKICPKGSFKVYTMEKGPLVLIVSIIQHISYTTYGINNLYLIDFIMSSLITNFILLYHKINLMISLLRIALSLVIKINVIHACDMNIKFSFQIIECTTRL